MNIKITTPAVTANITARAKGTKEIFTGNIEVVIE